MEIATSNMVTVEWVVTRVDTEIHVTSSMVTRTGTNHGMGISNTEMKAAAGEDNRIMATRDGTRVEWAVALTVVATSADMEMNQAVIMVGTDVARKTVDTVAVPRIMGEDNMVVTKAEVMEAKETVVAIQT